MIRSFLYITSMLMLILIMNSCSCPYCEKLEYKDTQTTIEEEVEKAALDLGKESNLQEEVIIEKLHSLVEENSRIFGANFAAVPGGENTSTIDAYYVYRNGAEIITLHNTSYNYEDAVNNSWIKKPLLLQKPLWGQPYSDTDTTGKEHYFITYSYPYIQNGNVAFIIAAEYLLDTE